MIPLNKPIRRQSKFMLPGKNINFFDTFIHDHFSEYFNYLIYSSRNGLQIIYNYLYITKGSLNVGVSPLVCFEALYPIIANGHKITFLDIDPETLNLDEKLLQYYNNLDVLQPIHLGGNPQNMSKISSWAKVNNVIVVEDCAQGIGSFFKNQHIGSFGDYSVFSLVKNLHTHAGSILFSRHSIDLNGTIKLPGSLIIYKKIKKYLEGGCSYKTNLTNFLYKKLLILKEQANELNPSKSYHLSKNTEKKLKSAFGYYQLFTSGKIGISNRIMESISPDDFQFQKTHDGAVTNRNRLLIISQKEKAIRIIRYLRKKGIAANNLTQSYLLPFQESVLNNRDFDPYLGGNKLITYSRLHDYIFSIPNSPGMNEDEINYIINTMNNCN